MKKTLIIAVLHAIVACSAFALPNHKKELSTVKNKITNKPVSLEVVDFNKVNLQILDSDKGKVNVTIYKNSGKKIYDESIEYDKSFNLNYDFSKFEEGNYKFVVNGKEIFHEQDIFLSKLYTEDIYAQIDQIEEKVIKVKVLRDDTPVKIMLSNSNGKVYYSKTYNGKRNFEQKFNLKRLRDENLEITISGKKSYLRQTL